MKNGFTLAETMVSVVIVLILTSVALMGYRQAIDNAYQKMCTLNQLLLLEGVGHYFADSGTSPATLGDLDPGYLLKAYAQAMHKVDWRTRLSYFVVKLHKPNQAYAAINNLEDLVSWDKMRSYGLLERVFHCPADRDGGISYGISTQLRNYSSWKDVAGSETIIGDCDQTTFSSTSELDGRHFSNFGTQSVAQTVTKDKKDKTEKTSKKDKGEKTSKKDKGEKKHYKD